MRLKRVGLAKVRVLALVFLLLILNITPIFPNLLVKADNTFSSTYILSFQDPEFSTKLVNNSSYVSISIPDCMLTSEPGAAQLPFYSAHILIPDGCRINDIFVSEQYFVDYSQVIKNKEVIFAEEETPFSLPIENNSLKKNQSWYELNSFQPAQAFDSLGVSYMKGYPVETVHFYPMRYHPQQNLLWFHKQLSITVTFSHVDASFSSTSNQFFRKQDSDANKVKELVLNPELVDTYPLSDGSTEGDTRPLTDGQLGESSMDESYPGGFCNTSEDYEYVIVTSEALASASSEPYNWTDLINHRQQRDGFSSCLVTMEEILACKDYFNETACFNDSAARLREFCKDAYLDWNTEYILLGGGWVLDDESKQIVPCRILTDVDETGETDNMASDLYFSNLDGDWYYDTGIWGGGRSGANDKLSELSVGRIPVWNAKMVSNSVKKIIWYDNCDDEDFLRSAGFLGGNLGWSITSKEYMEELRRGNGSFDQFEGFEEWNTAFPSYEIDTSGRYYDAEYESEDAAINAWKTAINNNELCLISHLDHGSASNTLSLLNGSSLSNSHFFLGTSQACLSGRFTSGESGASSFLGNWDDKGAFAMILNTGYGYGSSSSTAGKSQLQHKMFWDYFFANQTTEFTNWRLGLAMQYTKDKFSAYIDSLSSHVYAYVWYSWNLFGDPAQRIRLNADENDIPQFSSVSPVDDAVNVSQNVSSVSLIISDANGDNINWTIETSPSIGTNGGVNDSCGEKSCNVSGLEYYTQYTWFVNVSDGNAWNNQSFCFTTEIDPMDQPPVISNPFPSNNSMLIDVWTDTVSINISDPDGDNLSYIIQGEFVSDIVENNESNGTKNTSVLTPLPYDSNITWYVTVSDQRSYPVSEFFVFNTRQQYIPAEPQSFNVSTINRTAVSLNWTKNVSSDATIIERNTISQWNQSQGTQIYNGTGNSTIDMGLIPGVLYYYQIWGYNTTDMTLSNTSIFNNATTVENIKVNISNPVPVNNSIDCPVNLTFSINITDDETDQFNWTIQANETLNSSSVLDVNGTKFLQLINLSYYTVYTVWVNATDGFNLTSKWFQFRTALPNDTVPPIISSIEFSSSELMDGRSSYDWNHLNCTLSDDFRVANVSINITKNENSSSNLSLAQINDSSFWTLDFEESLLEASNITLFARDFNDNLNQTHLNIPILSSTLTFEHNYPSLDYLNLPIDLASITYNVQNMGNNSWNYSLNTIPSIGSKQGNISQNESIQVSLSTPSYDTSYECEISLENTFSLFVLTLQFSTEDEPDETNNLGGPLIGGGDDFLPPAAVTPDEEEQNLPPEIPLPPSGPAENEVGDNVTVRVSTWDRDHDIIRFKLEWGDGLITDWSHFVSSNDSVSFTHRYQEVGNYSIMVKAQDEQGLNSSWSPSFTINIVTVHKRDSADDGLVVKINNETGETQFSYDFNNSTQPVSMVWDFGDGVTIEGTSPIHRYLQPGTYSVTLTMTDEDGSVNMKTLTVTIPEPQQDVDTPIGFSEENLSSFPWIFVLVGIILSMVAAVVVVKLR